MTARVSVLLYVQHLLGLGHLTRAATLARHLSACGFSVTVATGGMPVPGIDFGEAGILQLPPLRAADSTFSSLTDETGAPATDAIFDARGTRLLAAFQASKPDIVITEHFPFGRRQLQTEILALLEACHARRPTPWVMASVRDVLVPPHDVDQCLGWIETYFDDILVHGDPAIIPLEASFPAVERLGSKIRYTGYVADPGPGSVPDKDRHEILVSAGGGAEAESLIEATLAARPLSLARDMPWRVLMSPSTTADEIETLRTRTDDGIIIEPFRRDFPALLARCRLSISRAGYNTVVETIISRTRSVVVPFETPRETEQAQRAGHFAAKNLCRVVRQSALTPESLAAAIDAALTGAAPDWSVINLDGAAATARLIAERTGWQKACSA
jgi:predicted glycosyltransferase